MKITKLISLLKQSDVIDDHRKLSLGSLYFVGSSIGPYEGSDIIAMPISLKQNVASLYVITAYRYRILKSSKKSVVIFPFRTHRLIAKIIRIFSIKINRKVADTIFNAFAGESTSEKNIITARIKRYNIDLIDSVITFSNGEIPHLKLHLIKRIMDVSEWPRVAIKKWAIYHLKLRDDSMNCIYNNDSIYNKKSLVDILQEHNTYSANNRAYGKKDSKAAITMINGDTIGVSNFGTNGTTTYVNIDTSIEDNENNYKDLDDLPF